MKAKKIASLILCGALAISSCAMLLAACGDEKEPEKPNPPVSGGEEGGIKFPDIAYTADDSVLYLVGGGNGPLGEQNNWTNTDDSFALTKNESNTKYNEYSVTLDLYEGNEFAVVYKDTWNDQMGFPSMYGAVDDKIVDENEKTIFESAPGGGATPNIKVSEGVNGKFKMTVYTFPTDKSQNFITWELVEEIPAWKVYYKMELNCDFNNLGMGKWDESSSFTDKGNGTWEYILTITEDNIDDAYQRRTAEGTVDADGDYIALQVANVAPNRTEYKDVEGGRELAQYIADSVAEDEAVIYLAEPNMNLLTYGSYRLIYTEATDTVVIEEYGFDIYLTGGFNSWNTTAENCLRFTEKGDGIYQLTYVAQSAVEVKPLNLYKDVADWNTLKGDNLNLTEGTWIIEANINEGTFKAEKLDYYLIGDINEWNITANSAKLTDNGDGTYSVTCELPANKGFKVVFGSVIGGIAANLPNGQGNYLPDGINNPTVETAGKYTITVNIEERTMDIVAVTE